MSLAASVALHAAALAAFFSSARVPEPFTLSRVDVDLRPLQEGAPAPLDAVILTVPGPADAVSASPASPLPNADLDSPGRFAAGGGGGGQGGVPTWTGRHDLEAWRAQMWNDPTAYRIPRVRTAQDRATSESITRRPDPRLDAQVRRAAPVARAGGAGQPGGDRPLGQTGEVRPDAARPTVKEGPTAVEADRHGAVRDDVHSAQASNERHPGLFEMTQPRAGGDDGEGAAGPRPGEDSSAESTREHGDAASTADLPVRPGGIPSMRARVQDPWLKLLHARVLSRVVWPRSLAVSYDQGEVVVAFTVRNSDGTVADVQVTTSSGHTEFDSAVVAAIRSAAPFGPVPLELQSPRGALRVSAPFAFENPIIR